MSNLLAEIGLRLLKAFVAFVLGVLLYVVLTGLLGNGGSVELALLCWISAAGSDHCICPVAGSQPSFSDRKSINTSASQNPGIMSMNIAPPVTVWSKAPLPFAARYAASAPRGTAITKLMTRLVRPMTTVVGIASRIISSTGRPLTSERPRSSCSVRPR